MDPLFDLRHSGGEHGKYYWCMPSKRRLDGGSRAVEWHRDDIEILRVFEHLSGSCGVVPVPAWAKLYLPGFALRKLINSLTLVAGMDGWTTRTFGETAARVTGAKSL
jgi:hypothetical protein